MEPRLNIIPDEAQTFQEFRPVGLFIIIKY